MSIRASISGHPDSFQDVYQHFTNGYANILPAFHGAILSNPTHNYTRFNCNLRVGGGPQIYTHRCIEETLTILAS